MTRRWQQVARAQAGEDYATAYARRFRELADRGEDPCGEARLVVRLRPAPARVLDAGCGTGRLTVRLTELGYEVMGVDADEAMLRVAREEAPALDFRQADLAHLDLDDTFDVVLLAGNIVPLLEPGTLADVCARLADHCAPDALVVCGFGLDAAHLPEGCPPMPLEKVDAAMTAAGLVAGERWSSWEGDPFDPSEGYVVTVHSPARVARSLAP